MLGIMRANSLRSILGASLLATLLLASGCAGDTDEPDAADPGGDVAPTATGGPAPAPTSDQPTAEETGSAVAEAPVEVPEVLQFQGRTIDGADFDGATVAGRPVVLWFWAPWCAVCRSQAPELSGLAETHGDTVAFVGIGSLDDEEAIADFAGEVSGVTLLSDEAGELWRRFGIVEQSSFVVLDAQGSEVLRTGYSDDDELAETVADLAG